MEYLLVILIGLIIIWAVYYYSNKAAQKGKKEEPEIIEKPKKTEEPKKTEASNLIINIPGFETPKAEKTRAGSRPQKSLDALYASSHGMWVCQYCETLNDGWALQCSACGAKK